MWEKIKTIIFAAKRAREKKVLDGWGRRKTRNYPLYYEKLLFNYQEHDCYIDQQSHDDLEFEKFFTFLDRTSSYIGQQFLYRDLRNANKSPHDLAKLENRISALKVSDKRELILTLNNLRTDGDYQFPHIIYGQFPEKTRFLTWIKTLQLLSFALLLFGTLYPVLYICFVPIMAVNLFLHYRHKANVGYYSDVLSSLNRLHEVGETVLKNLPYFSEEEHKTLKKDLKKVKSLLRKVRFLKSDKLIKTGAWYLTETAKYLTLTDVTTFESLIKSVKKERESIAAVYRLIGEADVVLSVLALRQKLPAYAIPQFSDTPGLEVTGLYHPLLENAVGNDLKLKNENLLVTGSNMSGKSTFIKAINLCAISAQVLNTAFATTYRSQVWRFATSINLQDDLESGNSYYLSEVERIGELINYTQLPQPPYLITIDEIFKGTNTVERVSAAAAVLTFLAGTAAMVLVSTHDLELTELLLSGFALYHFQEKVKEADLSFDYKIRPGVMTERNAIKILQLAGYPEAVIEEAQRISEITFSPPVKAPQVPPPSSK